ncbi:hypothetical protein KAR91_13890 [Candidatus Pacearchaeota archaeon]|nr:hypothetical protein [Candidatus Pacearchaeota archaeon]
MDMVGKIFIGLFVVAGLTGIITGLYSCKGDVTVDGWWSPPSGGITVLQGTYLFKYVLHEIHVTHTKGISDTTYVYRVLCQDAD